MKKQIITIEVELKNTNAMFAVKKIIGFRDWTFNDNFSVDLNTSNASLIFKSDLQGMEEVARIITGIEELNLGKEIAEEEES